MDSALDLTAASCFFWLSAQLQAAAHLWVFVLLLLNCRRLLEGLDLCLCLLLQTALLFFTLSSQPYSCRAIVVEEWRVIADDL